MLQAFLLQPNPGRIHNVCDDDRASPEDVLDLAVTLLHLPEPPMVLYEDAEMTPLARSFYAENKRVSNARIKSELGIHLRYPNLPRGIGGVVGSRRL